MTSKTTNRETFYKNIFLTGSKIAKTPKSLLIKALTILNLKELSCMTLCDAINETHYWQF